MSCVESTCGSFISDNASDAPPTRLGFGGERDNEGFEFEFLEHSGADNERVLAATIVNLKRRLLTRWDPVTLVQKFGESGEAAEPGTSRSH